MIEVAIVEDDEDVRESYAALIAGAADFSLAGSFSDWRVAVEKLSRLAVEVILMDIAFPDDDRAGIRAVRTIKSRQPEVDVIMLTAHQQDTLVFESLCAGACGYLLKTAPAEKILHAIREIHSGGAPMTANIARMVVNSFQIQPQPDLTPREQEILSLLCEGKSYSTIADAFFISRETAKFHIKNIYKKLHVHSKSEAVAKALKQKLI